MIEKYKRRAVFSMLIVLTVILSAVLWYQDRDKKRNTKAAELKQGTAYFSNATARPGTPVEVVAANYPMFTQLVYEWRVDGELIEHDGSSYTPVEADLEKMITVTVRADGYEEQMLSMYCSKLPVLYIDTDDGTNVESKDEYKSAYYVLQGAGEGPYETVTGGAWVKGRGNYSWTLPKTPYKLKLDDEADLLGMGENKHWVLIPNMPDPSLMRNTLSCWISEQMGLVSMKTKWVALVVNGSCMGNYQLCQQIRPGADRVPAADWEELSGQVAETVYSEGGVPGEKEELKAYLEQNLSWMSEGVFEFKGKNYTVPDQLMPSALTGGFVLEIDISFDRTTQFFSHVGLPIMVCFPEYAKSNQELMDYIVDYVQAVEDAAYDEEGYGTFRGKSVHYSELVDMDSLVNYWLVSELFYNVDFDMKSIFLYKDIEGKLFLGPIWDMDLTCGIGDEREDSYTLWATWNSGTKEQTIMWYRPLIKNRDFVRQAFEAYHRYRPLFQEMVRDGGMIDQYYGYLCESGQADAKRWREEADDEYFERAVYQELKPWLINRLVWMDEQFASEETLAQSLNAY